MRIVVTCPGDSLVNTRILLNGEEQIALSKGETVVFISRMTLIMYTIYPDGRVECMKPRAKQALTGSWVEG
jgi:hypothetical protein